MTWLTWFQVCELYEKMCVSARNEQNTDDEKLNWMKTWVDPVILVLCNSPKMTKTNIIEVRDLQVLQGDHTLGKKSLKSLNFRPVLEILEKSLNSTDSFGRSLKGTWILKIEIHGTTGWPHPWKNPWNSDWPLKSWKSPWIPVTVLEGPWKVLEFSKWSLKSLNLEYSTIYCILFPNWRHCAAYLNIRSRCSSEILTSLKIMERYLKCPWVILEFCHGNFVSPCTTIQIICMVFPTVSTGKMPKCLNRHFFL